VITGEDETDTPIPGAGYTFAVLKRAQALGDTETLVAHARRTVRIHLGGSTSSEALERLFAEALA
jgi:transaldolase / glucose-6-phosphate isomerase